jgi:hypothetical protein
MAQGRCQPRSGLPGATRGPAGLALVLGDLAPRRALVTAISRVLAHPSLGEPTEAR